MPGCASPVAACTPGVFPFCRPWCTRCGCLDFSYPLPLPECPDAAPVSTSHFPHYFVGVFQCYLVFLDYLFLVGQPSGAGTASLPERIWRRRNQPGLAGPGFSELSLGCPYLGEKRSTSGWWVRQFLFLQVCVFPFSRGVDGV